MTKAYSIFLTGLFSLFIGGILVGSLLLPDRTFSPHGEPQSGQAAQALLGKCREWEIHV